MSNRPKGFKSNKVYYLDRYDKTVKSVERPINLYIKYIRSLKNNRFSPFTTKHIGSKNIKKLLLAIRHICR